MSFNFYFYYYNKRTIPSIIFRGVNIYILNDPKNMSKLIIHSTILLENKLPINNHLYVIKHYLVKLLNSN